MTDEIVAQLDLDEVRLLRTYTGGPRIWDAASVFAVVVRLAENGLLAPSGLGGAYALTDAGRRALPAESLRPVDGHRGEAGALADEGQR